MSSELERLLREAGQVLPEPDASVTRRARERALAAFRGGRRFRRSTLALGAALLLATGAGVGIGALLAPSGSATPAPVGLGFLPERGWNVLQSGTEATGGSPAQAIATNVPLSSKDAPDSLPYFTLLGLPRNGVVIIASFGLRGVQPSTDAYFPARKLPLRLRDAAPQLRWGVQLRPRRPLGQYQLAAAVNGHNVDVSVYFGSSRPSPALITTAQRQLDRLVVRQARERPRVDGRALPLRSAASSNASAAAPRALDRTFLCSRIPGVFEVDVRAHDGIRDGSAWRQLPWAELHSGGFSGSQAHVLDNSLAWVSAGRPDDMTLLHQQGRWLFPAHATGLVAWNRRLCTQARARVPLSSKGLQGGAPGPFGQEFDCPVPRRVLVRVRAVLQSPGALYQDRHLLKTRVPLKEGYLAVRTQAGRQLVFASVTETGKARLFTAPSCIPD